MRRRRDFEQAVARIYAAAADPTAWPAALTAVADQVGGVGGMLLLGCGAGTRIETGRLDPDLVALFRERHLDNRYAARARDLPPDRPVLGSAVWDPAEARRSALHAEILLPQRIEDKVFSVHAPRPGGGVAGGISVYLGPRAAAEPGRVLCGFARLLPHLRQSLDLGAALLGARQVGACLLQALAAMPGAAILVDGERRIWHATPGAEALLREGDGLTAHRDPGGGLLVSAQRPAERAALARLVAAAAAGAPGGRLRVTRPCDGPPHDLLVVPLQGEAAAGAPKAAIVFGLPDHAPAIATLRAAFGLTQAEARVAQHLARGQGIPATAAAIGVSQDTVRSQAARIFDATGARSQAALAGVLARLPDPVAADAPGGTGATAAPAPRRPRRRPAAARGGARRGGGP
jgi:DNA-binding CsgD family transcriptional regulator